MIHIALALRTVYTESRPSRLGQRTDAYGGYLMNQGDNNIPVTTQTLISIIMPVYNAESHLEETLVSALGQSIKDFELICVDDGSTDDSVAILRRFEKEDGRVRVLSQENSGAGPARNAGLEAARGSYIAFLDSDDLYPSKNCLEELYDLAVAHKAKIAGGSLLFLENGNICKAVTKDADFTFPDVRIIEYKDFQQAYYYQRFIYSREMLNDAKIRFPEYRRFQDVVFFVRAMTEAGEFLSTDIPTYVYRKSQKYASLTDTQINDMLRGYLDVLSIAKANAYSGLFTFLSGRVSGHGSIRKMIESSIENGNRAAGKLYADVLTICESPFEDTPVKEEKNPGSLVAFLRHFFPKSEK